MRAPILKPVGKVGRKHRRPTHTFQVRHMPWTIQPFMIAPVLPGETLKNILLQSRAVTKPIKNGLVGWWLEHHFFYVKHRDLDARDLLTGMMLDPTANTDSLNTAADVKTYHRGTAVNWVKLCLDRIVATYFRDEDEVATAFTIDSMPVAQIGNNTWADSLVPEDFFGASTDVELTVGADDKITGSEIDQTMRMWEFLRANNLTDASYEDYLATFGIRSPPAENHRPELIRSVRNWSYPVNHVEPTTGVPASAVSWAVAERADKDRFFAEPGFIFGVTIVRPKVYFNKQTGSITSVMKDAISWLPAILSNDPYTSVKPFAAGTGPLPAATDGYWIDIKDLLLYGEQFLNFAVADTSANLVALPANNIRNKRFPAKADVDGLFTAAADAGRVVEQDGICHLDILGHQVDTTPQGIQG